MMWNRIFHWHGLSVLHQNMICSETLEVGLLLCTERMACIFEFSEASFLPEGSVTLSSVYILAISYTTVAAARFEAWTLGDFFFDGGMSWLGVVSISIWIDENVNNWNVQQLRSW